MNSYNTLTHIHTHPLTHTQINTHTHVSQNYTNPNTHIQTYTHTHTHKHIHTHLIIISHHSFSLLTGLFTKFYLLSKMLRHVAYKTLKWCDILRQYVTTFRERSATFRESATFRGCTRLTHFANL